MKVFYTDAHLSHHPTFEVFDGGVRTPTFEVPERATRILQALRSTDWAEIQGPSDFGLQPILAVHNADYLQFLASAWTEWLAADPAAAASADGSALLPSTFPPAGWRRKPVALLGRAGYYMMDLSAPIVAGTYAAALAAANCALSGAQAVRDGERAAFALCRPPGHHAGKANCGGYCYLNNAAIAANWLSAAGRTALLDVDYHAGNGTQDIFYDRNDVLTISIHADPGLEYPYFSGYADERGEGPGAGFHRNYPLAPGTDDAQYLATLRKALTLIREFEPAHLVISAGMDIYEADPLGKIRVSRAGIKAIGEEIAALKLPSEIVMEGGYNNDALGENVIGFLSPFALE
ncbi:MAG TPA: histone deacetylase family protein [Anaerolineales bacterium]|jgi:acetoin utilization deacetylase AcuC-like enzyme